MSEQEQKQAPATTKPQTPAMKKVNALKGYLSKTDNLERLNGIFGNDEKKVARFKDSLLIQVNKNPKLLECSTASILQCAFDVALSGLIPDGRDAHLIPFKDKCTVVFDYKGIVKMILNNHDYIDVKSVIVFENENFGLEFGDVSHHQQILDPTQRGEAVGCYSMVKHLSGNRLFSYMSKEEILKIRNESQGYKAAKRFNKSSIWDDNEFEMWKKTCIRRHAKTLRLDVDATHLLTVPEVDSFKDFSNPSNSGSQKVKTDLFDMKDAACE